MKKKHNTSNKNNNENDISYEELLRSLSTENMRIAIIYIVIISLILDLIYAHNKRSQILDSINETKYANYSTEIEQYPFISRNLNMFVAIILVRNRLDDLNYVLSSYPVDEKAVKDAEKSLLAAILAFFAVMVSPPPTIADAASLNL